jgi:CRP-like cAMP-binding protein
VEFRNYLLADLSEGLRDELLPGFGEVALARGQVQYEVGQAVDYVYFPSTAVLSVVTVMRNGQAVESSTIGRESAAPLLCALASRPARSRIFAQIGGSAIRLSAERLRAAVRDGAELMQRVMDHAGSIAFQAEQGVACNILHDASSRLSRWLLMTQDRMGSDILPLTQDYMAIMVGVQRSTISAVANQLRGAGLIRFSRGNVEVLDRAGLEARACECYGVIRREFDGLRSLQYRADV